MGVAGAAIIGDSVHAGCFEHDGPLRAVIGVLVPLGMAAAGGVIGSLAGRRRTAWWLVLSGVALLAAGALLGGLVGLVCWRSPDGLAMGLLGGFVYGAAAFVVSMPVLLLMRRLESVRIDSVTAQSRHVVTWCGGGLSAALGASLALAASHPVVQCVAPETSVLSLVAVSGALVALVAAGVSSATLNRGRALCASALELQEQPGPAPIVGPTSVDLGIGEAAWTAPCATDPYRHAVAPEPRFVGDPSATLRSLHHDAQHALLCALAALAAAASTVAAAPARASLPATAQEGGASPDDEAIVRRDIDPAARYCVAPRFHLRPIQRPPIVLGLRIAPDGMVDQAWVPGAPGLPIEAVQCIVFVARRTRFPSRDASDTLRIALDFHAP